MKRFFPSAFLVLAVAGLPLASHATALDAPLVCNESGHQFIADLAQQQLIDPKPTRVESNSINAFSPTSGADLTAFGFRVFAVVGYEKDDPMFRVGDGEPLARSAYGVVVFGGETKVRNAIAGSGGTAIVHRDRDFWDWVADTLAIVAALAPMLLVWWRNQFRGA